MNDPQPACLKNADQLLYHIKVLLRKIPGEQSHWSAQYRWYAELPICFNRIMTQMRSDASLPISDLVLNEFDMDRTLGYNSRVMSDQSKKKFCLHFVIYVKLLIWTSKYRQTLWCLITSRYLIMSITMQLIQTRQNRIWHISCSWDASFVPNSVSSTLRVLLLFARRAITLNKHHDAYVLIINEYQLHNATNTSLSNSNMAYSMSITCMHSCLTCV